MKKIFILVICIVYTISSWAQEVDSTRKWYRPDHFKTQFAGGIGFLSAGLGIVSKNQKLENDLFLGFLPEKFGGDALLSVYSEDHLFALETSI